MKILHVIPSVASCRGGPSQAVLAMARSQRRMGIDAEVITSTDNGKETIDVATGVFVDYEGARVCFLPRWSPGVAGLREFQFSASLPQWLANNINDYDCLHVHGVFSFFPTYAMRFARRAGKPYIARPLGQLHPWSLQQGAFKKRLYLAVMERANLVAAAAIHCTSEAEAGHVKALLPTARVTVVPHGVDGGSPLPEARQELRTIYGLPDTEPVILFLSRWHRKKNIGLLLEALAKIKDLTWTLVLAGATDDEKLIAEIEQQCVQLGLADRVKCPGHVSGRQKEVLLQGATVFVLPSASENFGIAVAEALVHGLPVVITPGVDLADTVVKLEGGIVSEPDASSISEALREVLGNWRWTKPAARVTLANAARAHFSWDANAQALHDVYVAAISHPHLSQ